MAFVVALSGGVAAGKSAVSDRLQAQSVPVLDADLASREVVAPGSDGLAEVVAAFGRGALAADGSLDRRAMRERIFSDSEARRRLEAIIHPRVRAWLQQRAAASPEALVVLAIPLLVESGHYDWVDRTVMVDSRGATQLQRLMQRDRVDLELARRMLAAQAPRSQRLAIADEVIANDGSLAELHHRVDACLADWRRRAELSRNTR
jgi:dephospho-CoA kinase